MRYGIFSDVHGNIEALDGVLDYLADKNIDRYAFLGDAVGYGANPDEVCSKIREVADIAIVGNHDAAVAGRMDYSEYYDAARQALDWCANQLSSENMAWLEKLPYKVREGEIEFSHGSPIDPHLFDYLFSPEQVVDLFDVADQLAHVTFIGHSHLTIAFSLNNESVTPILAGEIPCGPDSKHIITAGSVGQPRDRDPRACCGIFDTDNQTFTYYRVPYDIQKTRQKIIDAGLSPIFGERLLVGM